MLNVNLSQDTLRAEFMYQVVSEGAGALLLHRIGLCEQAGRLAVFGPVPQYKRKDTRHRPG